MTRRYLTICVSALLVFASATFGQQPTATLTGKVVDPNGAVVSGVTVTVTHLGTNSVRTTTTNADGIYTFAALPVGEADLDVPAALGFGKRDIRGIALSAGQTVSANVEVFPAAATINVPIEPYPGDRVDTQTSKVDTVIQSREIENLPLNGRNFLELALLTPGNAPAPNFDPTKAGTVVISSAGQLGRGGNVMVDGTDNNDDVVGGPLVNVSQDAVGEFQVATNRFSAEYGRSGSSVINVVTKSGTNEVRGSAAAFFRDNSLQSLPATANPNAAKPPFDRQQYSFTLGGPIKKDRAWGFGAFEMRDQDGAVQVRRRVVATRTFETEFAPAPLKNYLLITRFDASLNDDNRLSFRYTFEDIKATDSSKLDRASGSASYRETLKNRFHAFQGALGSVFSPRVVNDLSFSINDFANDTQPVTQGIQYTFPSMLDGSSFRVPQATEQRRLQLADTLSMIAGNHTLKFGGEFQSIKSSLALGVFRQGRIEFVQDFANQDRNQDGTINDGDLLFAVTLRSGLPNQDLVLPDVDNKHFAFFVQDDWRLNRNFTVNLGLRYQIDTNEKNIDGYENRNPIVEPFYRGTRRRDTNNWAPRIGFNWSTDGGGFSLHGGFGIYYDRIVLQLITLERGLDGRALPVQVRAGNALTAPNGQPIFLDMNGNFVPGAPTFANPFTGFILPGAGASGINIIDNDLQNPMVRQSNIGIQWEVRNGLVLKADYLNNFGTEFVIGRNVGVVNNPVVGGPDRVVNLESSAKTYYDGLLMSLERRFSKRYGFRASYTLSRSRNYANDDQIPFSNGPIDSNNLRRELGPAPNDQRHRFVAAGTFDLGWGVRLSPIVTFASGVPMDILLPDGSSRVPQFQRNAGGRVFRNASELNAAITAINSAGGVNGAPLPLAPGDARFNDNFGSVDARLSKVFKFGERFRLEPMVEVFNIFNQTNILGRSNTNYSGFGNVLGSSSFGRPLTTAGGVFGSGGPRAFQLAGRFSF